MKHKKRTQRKPSFADESTTRLLQYVKVLMRPNYGGKDPSAVVAAKLAARGVNAGPVTVRAVVEIVEDMVETLRRATHPRIDEAVRRVGAVDLYQALFGQWLTSQKDDPASANGEAVRVLLTEMGDQPEAEEDLP